MTVVSWSEVDTARQCFLKHQLSYRERLRRDGKTSRPLVIGDAWHKMLEVHYAHCAKNEDGSDEVRGVLHDTLDHTDIEGLELLQWMYDGYKAQWGFDRSWKVEAIEEHFELPIPGLEGYWIKGYIDLIATDEYGKRWIWDHKTGKQKPKQSTYDLLDQFVVYTWAIRELGWDVQGCLHNYAKTNRLKKAQPLDSRFSRTRMARTDTELRETMLDVAKTIAIAYSLDPEQDAPRSVGDHCAYRCDYSDACMTARRGKSEIRPTLEALGFEIYTKRN